MRILTHVYMGIKPPLPSAVWLEAFPVQESSAFESMARVLLREKKLRLQILCWRRPLQNFFVKSSSHCHIHIYVLCIIYLEIYTFEPLTLYYH